MKKFDYKNNKKAQSISINTIIVAAIALVVMILVVMIFTTNMTRFRRGADSCESHKGVCINQNEIDEKCSGDYSLVNRNYQCFKINGDIDETKVCCIKT
ncbi:MAG: hypothetical protein QXE31_05720 [Candidatus Woesearchaeota archaeon]